MHKFSRSLLVAGVMAFGTLSAACGDKVTVAGPGGAAGVQLVTVTPQSATIAIGESIILSGQVTADAASAKTVSWSTSNAGVANVDQAGKVTGVAAGTASITATSTADASKAASAVVTVSSVGGPQAPQVSISTVNQGGVPAVLTNVANQLDVTLLATGGAGTIELFLAPQANCTTNTIAATDVLVAQQNTVASETGPITLSFNTAAVVANAAQFPNGQYCIKSRLTTDTGVAIATNTIPLTLNNANVFSATLQFASETGGPTSAVSTLNGLNYNQGTMTATITPIIFSSSAPVALISGSFSRNGELANGAPPQAPISFTNLAVTNGVATITFTDTSLAGVNSIFRYTSLPAGDNLTINSATDAAGNPITLTGPVAVAGATGVRIDNDIPLNAATTYTVLAPNGYVGAAYEFADGTGGTAAADIAGGVQGVGGVTTTYYVGAASADAFDDVNSCDVTGLTAGTTGADLANTTATTTDRVKVVVQDALGNKTCQDVVVTTTLGPSATFGVDKVAPNATLTDANNGAETMTGYNVSKNWSFIYNDTISGFDPAKPLQGTLLRNFFTTGGTAADCVIGVYDATDETCTATDIVPTTTFGVPPNAGGSIEFTAGTLVDGYYSFNAIPVDRALNEGTAISAIAAYDATAPAVGTLTQSPAAAVAHGTVTVTGTATDNFDLASAYGNLSYATAPVPFQRVAAGAFPATFDATLVQSLATSVALPRLYRGLQSVDGAGVIQANSAAPAATITAVDVGTNTGTSAALTIATSTALTNVLAGNSFTATPTNAAPATRQATTTITALVSGAVVDPAFQSQPFDQIDLYKVDANGELAYVSSIVSPTATDVGAVRTYVYTATGVALTADAVNTFHLVGRTAAGDAVLSNAIVVTNP